MEFKKQNKGKKKAKGKKRETQTKKEVTLVKTLLLTRGEERGVGEAGAGDSEAHR